MNRPPTGRPVGARPGSKREVEPEQPPRFYVALTRKGERWPYGCVGPMERAKAEQACASWRRSGASAEITSVPIGKNLTERMEMSV